jgi:hypothetical protein
MSCAQHPQADVLLASTLYLMTRYYAHRCPCVANAVARHLDLLSQQAEGRCSAMLRAVCAQLELDWRAFTDGLAAGEAGPRH